MKPTFLFLLFLFATIWKQSFGEDACPFLVCGENAIKTVDPNDVTDCYCSCPHNAQGDPLFKCNVMPFGITPTIENTRFIVKPNDSTSSWPWMASIGYNHPVNITWVHQCGGSLITHRHVLTAAHCTTNPEFLSWSVLLGLQDLQSSEGGVEVNILNHYIHPKFEEIPRSSYYDVAILVLKKAVAFSSEIRPVQIPNEANENPDIYSGASVTIMGWGDTSGILKSADVQIYSIESCNKKYEEAKVNAMRYAIGSMLPQNFTRGVFCAGNPHNDYSACHGDSGGPMVKFIDSADKQNGVSYFEQIGLIEGGAKCGSSEVPGVFVSLNDKTVLDFVQEKAGMKKGHYWGPWSPFSKCSVTCGDGVQRRQRSCALSQEEACAGDNQSLRHCNWGACPQEIFELTYIAVTISQETFSGCDCKIFIQLTNPATSQKCTTLRLNKPGNDWAQGTTDTWATAFLGPCLKFSVSPSNPSIEIDFLLSGRDHIQVDAVTASFKSTTSTNEIEFNQFCLGWSNKEDLKWTDRFAEKPSLLSAKMYQRETAFEISETNMTWSEAKKFCKSRGLRLAEAHSHCQNLRLVEFLHQRDPRGEMTFWIGLSYKPEQGDFTWNESDQSPSFTNWDTKPHDVTNSCVQIQQPRGSTRKWKNINCSYNLNVFALCQIIS